MLSTVSLELSRDSCLNWKTVIKGRQRAIRRARTSFTCENKRKPATRTYKGSENATNEESNITGDLPISESEKVLLFRFLIFLFLFSVVYKSF